MGKENEEEIHPGRRYIDWSAFMENPRKHQRKDPVGGVGSTLTACGLTIYATGFRENSSGRTSLTGAIAGLD